MSNTMSNIEIANADDYRTTDVLVVGSGIAGLTAALGAARNGATVMVARKATRPAGTSSWWAQGGIAVYRDDPEQFRRDIMAASAGTANSDAVDVLVKEANAAVEDVLVDTLGVEFDTTPAGGANGESRGTSSGKNAGTASDERHYDFAREAAHDERRILHVDATTGKHLQVPFLTCLDDHDDVEIVDDTASLDLISHEGRIHGALLEHDGEVTPTVAGATVLATGGIGDLYPRSTNPDGLTGDGIAMAMLAGADVTDLEYVQFHPTVCMDAEGPTTSNDGSDGASAPADGTEDLFLVSEAVRGEGAVLRNADGGRLMPDYHADAELAPRDVVARAVHNEVDATGDVVLDVSPLEFAVAFPGLAEKCETRGIDWESGIPVEPAEHFLCGGIDVDVYGRTSLERLDAVGECAHTGVHGANRLASTSLLEGLVWGLRAGEDAGKRVVDGMPTGHGRDMSDEDATVVEAPELLDRDPELPDSFAREKFVRLRQVMDEYVGLRRQPDELARAQAVLRRLKGEVDAYVRTRTSRSLYELRHATVTALLIARAAADNDESIGTHNLVDESITVPPE